MVFSRFSCLAMAVASLVMANPTPMPINPRDLSFRPVTNELLIREARERGLFVPRSPLDLVPLDESSLLEKRISEDFSLEQTLENEVLFDGFSIPLFAGPPLLVVCRRCCTKGTITASLTIEDIIEPTLRFDLNGLEAFIELDVVSNASASFAIPLFRQPPSPLGISIPGGPKIGLLFFVDLIISVSASVDLTGGFIIKLPDEAFVEASIFDGVVGDLGFDGIVTKEIPIVVNNGATSVTFQADLQLRAQLGIDASTDLAFLPGLPDIGAAAEVGVFVNIIEFIATLGVVEDCALQATEEFNLNVGAFANFGVEINTQTFGAVPSVSTTLLETAFTQCLVANGLPFPTRTVELPTGTAASCQAVVTGAAVAAPALQTGSAGGKGVVIVALPVTTAPPYPVKRCPTCHAGNATALLATETVFATSVVTVIGCAAPVPNCPADMQSTATYTSTICADKPTPTGLCPDIADLVPLPSVSTPIVGTFTGLPATTTSPDVTVTATTSVATFTFTPPTQSPGGVFLEPNSTATIPSTGTGSPAASTSGPVFVNGGIPELRIGASMVAMVGGVAALVVLF